MNIAVKSPKHCEKVAVKSPKRCVNIAIKSPKRCETIAVKYPKLCEAIAVKSPERCEKVAVKSPKRCETIAVKSPKRCEKVAVKSRKRCGDNCYKISETLRERCCKISENVAWPLPKRCRSNIAPQHCWNVAGIFLCPPLCNIAPQRNCNLFATECAVWGYVCTYLESDMERDKAGPGGPDAVANAKYRINRKFPRIGMSGSRWSLMESRDVARQIVAGLRSPICPCWYDSVPCRVVSKFATGGRLVLVSSAFAHSCTAVAPARGRLRFHESRPYQWVRRENNLDGSNAL